MSKEVPAEDVITAAGGICAPTGYPFVESFETVAFRGVESEVVLAPRKVYGVAEVARIVGQKRKKILRWVKKGRVPAPSDWLSTGPVWLAEIIEPWLRKYLTPGGAVRDALGRFPVQRGEIRFKKPPSLKAPQ